jgi:hypothetical protein
MMKPLVAALNALLSMVIVALPLTNAALALVGANKPLNAEIASTPAVASFKPWVFIAIMFYP